MTAFISIRVSTREQAADGCSLPVQVRECSAYCRQAGIELHPSATNCDQPGIFADPGISAWKIPIFQRPGFQKLWQNVNRNDSIVFLSLDRAFRSTKDFIDSWEVMKAAGVSPIFVRNDIRMDTAAGQLWGRTIASFAEYQSAVISERVREANAIRKMYGTTRSKSSRQSRAASTEIPNAIKNLYRPKEIKSPNEVTSGRVFAYARVSTLDQDSQPQSLRLESGIEYRMMNGYSRGGLFVDDGVSAFFTDFHDRPAGSKIWNQLQRGDVIICTKMDRMFRSTLDMANVLKVLSEKGVTICTLDGSLSTETPEGRAIASYLCIMAQWESESISWRTILALDSIRRQRGPWIQINARFPRWISKIEYGENKYRLQVVPEIIRDAMTMRDLRKAGLTINQVSDILQRQHEAEFNLPVEIPRCGFGSRRSLESRLKAKSRFADAALVVAYCDKFGIGWKDPIDRFYSLQRNEVHVLSNYADDDSLMMRYLDENDGDLKSIYETIGAVA
jgi:DNA invertase Pin-like site-specific DNA recombinase